MVLGTFAQAKPSSGRGPLSLHPSQCAQACSQAASCRRTPLTCACACAGAKSTFQRRKSNAMCYYGVDYQRPPPTVTPCKCTEDDTACDYGYWKDEGGRCSCVGALLQTLCLGAVPLMTLHL